MLSIYIIARRFFVRDCTHVLLSFVMPVSRLHKSSLYQLCGCVGTVRGLKQMKEAIVRKIMSYLICKCFEEEHSVALNVLQAISRELRVCSLLVNTANLNIKLSVYKSNQRTDHLIAKRRLDQPRANRD